MRIASFASASLVLAALALGACASAPQKSVAETRMIPAVETPLQRSAVGTEDVFGVKVPANEVIAKEVEEARARGGEEVEVGAVYAWVAAKDYGKVVSELGKGNKMDIPAVNGKKWQHLPRLSVVKGSRAYVMSGSQTGFVSKLDQVRHTNSAKVTVETVAHGVSLLADARKGNLELTVGGAEIVNPISQMPVHMADGVIMGHVERPEISKETATLELAGNNHQFQVARWKTYEGGPYRLVFAAWIVPLKESSTQVKP